MTERKLLVYFLTFLFLLPLPASAAVQINEVMSSNGATLIDEDGDYEDWVELYNDGDSPVALNGFGLSDDMDRPFRWIFPDISLGQGQFLVVFASNKNRRRADSELHTDFAINSSGEMVFLTSPDGVLVDHFPSRPIPRDVSLGRIPEDALTWHFFDPSTPGAPNITEPLEAILDPPQFSVSSGFYTEPFPLALTSPDDGATIRYTLDGSLPDSSSQEYRGPITIASRRGEPNTISTIRSGPAGDWAEWQGPSGEVFKSTVIRAATFREGALQSAPVTRNYFVDSEIHDRYHVPVICLTTAPDNLFSDETGIYVPGDFHDGETWNTGNYFQRGSRWERPVHVAFFDEDGTEQLSQDAGIRVHGGSSRRFSPKALRLNARAVYGNEGFNYPVFGQHHTAIFERLLLRTSGNDFTSTLFRDAMMQDLIADLGLDQQAYRPSVVFINGEYWGLHNIRERVDNDYLHHRYGVDPDNLDMLGGDRSVLEGDSAHYDEMLRYIEEHDLSKTEHYEHLQTLMDTDNFSAYFASQIYFANTDWPNGNIKYWRNKTIEYQPDSPRGHDGRWRWILFDTDHGFGFGKGSSYRHNTLDLATHTAPEWSTFLFRSLLENKAFQFKFINDMADLLNTVFKPSEVVNTIRDFQNEREPLIQEHIARWGYPTSIDVWRRHIDETLVPFAMRRPEFVRHHILNYFELDGLAEVTINLADVSGGRLRINTVDLEDAVLTGCHSPDTAYPWRGVYFQGIPVSVEAIPEEGYIFSHWDGLPPGTGPEVTIDLTGDISITAHFENVSEANGAFSCALAKRFSTLNTFKRYLGDLFLLACVGVGLLVWPIPTPPITELT